jgi:hypothetical protein
MSPLTLSRVKILWHFTGGGDSSVLGEEVSFGVGRGRCRIGLSRSCASLTKVVTSSMLALAFFTRAILSLYLSERAVFGDGDSSFSAEHERFGWSPFAFGRDHLSGPADRLFCDGGRSCCLRVAFFDEVKDGGVGFLLPLSTPELQRLMLVHRVRCIMEGSWHQILRRFQCLKLCFGHVDLALVSPLEVSSI